MRNYTNAWTPSSPAEIIEFAEPWRRSWPNHAEMNMIATIPSKKVIPQSSLRALRELSHKQRELQAYIGHLSSQLLAELESGATIERGDLRATIRVSQRGRRRVHRLIVR